jgi:integrase
MMGRLSNESPIVPTAIGLGPECACAKGIGRYLFGSSEWCRQVGGVHIPAATLAALETHRAKQDEFRRQFGRDYRSDLDLIFANPDGAPLRPDSISATVSALFQRLKIRKPKGASLHLLRHSHGSHLLANGVPLPVVSERLGHSSVRVTADAYSHAINSQDEEAVRKWEEFQQRNRAADASLPRAKP